MKNKIVLLSIFCLMCFNSSFGQWKQVFNNPSGKQVHPVFCYGNRILVHNNNGIYLSLDSGKTWNLKDSSFAIQVTTKIIDKDSLLIAASLAKGAYTSLDSGETWQAPTSWQYTDLFTDIILSGNNIVGILRESEKIIVSKDNGKNWDTATKDVPKIPSFQGSLTRLGVIGNLTLVFYACNLYASDDNGINWHYRSTTPCLNGAVITFHNKLFASTNSNGNRSIYESLDSGVTWTKSLDLRGINGVTGLYTDGKTIFATIFGLGLGFSTDSGKTWGYNNTGLTSLNLYSLAWNKDYIYCGADSGKVFGMPLSTITLVNIENKKTESDLSIKIYPNPVQTVLNIETNKDLHHANISIYDITGKEVQVLKNINGNYCQLQRNGMTAGDYILIVNESGKRILTKKFEVK